MQIYKTWIEAAGARPYFRPWAQVQLEMRAFAASLLGCVFPRRLRIRMRCNTNQRFPGLYSLKQFSIHLISLQRQIVGLVSESDP